MNIGSLKYPLVSAVYSSDCVNRTAVFDIGNLVMASGYGYHITNRFGTYKSTDIRNGLFKILSVPVLWAVIIGLIINLAGLEIPIFITKAMTNLSLANSLFAMLALEILFNFESSRWKLMSMTVFFRMGIGFLFGQFVILLTRMQNRDHTIVTMASAMPIGIIPLAYAAAEGLDTDFGRGCPHFLFDYCRSGCNTVVISK